MCGNCLCFFFQAEDGIRDKLVTGVQTCALPILGRAKSIVIDKENTTIVEGGGKSSEIQGRVNQIRRQIRSEERRVGKECRTRRPPYNSKYTKLAPKQDL